MNLTEDQILTLAPDEASKKAGKDLAKEAKWVTKGANGTALWGECQGSGSKPYQTAIDLMATAFKCSCPSRKFPCKHGLALALLYTKESAIFSSTEAPAWVAEWMAKRATKEEKKAAPKEKVVDEVAQAKRQQAREQKVADGIQELLLWIKDIIRNGIMNMPERGYAYWSAMAKRMVDAQAPGLAGMVRTLGVTNFYKEGWQSTFLDNLLNIYLVIKGYQHIHFQPPLLQQDIRSLIGFKQSGEDLKERAGVVDIWLVLGKQLIEDDSITVERNWLYGIKKDQYALVLQFLVKGGGGQLTLTPGMYLEAELVYYPSATPLRALMKHQINTEVVPPETIFTDWLNVVKYETELYSQLPVQYEQPYLIEALTPVFYNEQWWLKDQGGNLMLIKEDYSNIWKLLSLSGGEPLTTAVIGKETIYEPIGAWHQNQYKSL